MNNLKENFKKVHNRVSAACRAAGRNSSEITVLAVSKKHSIERIGGLYDLGQRAFGENYVQEALAKMEQIRQPGMEWHFIGPIQSNKTREIAAHFDWAQSVDREKVLRRLAQQRPEGSPPLNICIQVNIDREPQKAGVEPGQVLDLAMKAMATPGVRLRGLMAIPRLGSPGHDPSDSYRRMRELFLRLLDEGLELDTLSIGMSADLESAIMNGSTMIRIGTDLFGPRPGSAGNP